MAIGDAPKANKEVKAKNANEIFRVTIERILTSPEFESNLQKTLAMVLKHKREAGFAMVQEKRTSKIHYSRPIGGSNENSTAISRAYFETEHELEKKYHLSVEREDFFSLGSLHFHGYEPGVNVLPTIIPSEEDILSALDFGSLAEFPQIEMIANMRSKAEVEIFLYKEPEYPLIEKPNILKELTDTLPELFRENASQEEVVQVFRRYGFKVCMIFFKNGKLTKESLDSIRLLKI